MAELVNSSIVQADHTKLQQCADFRRKWTPTQICNVSKSERTTMLLELLVDSDSIFAVQMDGGDGFATKYNHIHEAMPLRHNFNTNK